VSTDGCPVCSGFRWVPEERDHPQGNWYARDWRLMLDPTVSWRPCPRCSEDTVSWQRLHGDLSALLLKRIDQDARRWVDNGQWRSAIMDGWRRFHRWRHLACLVGDDDRWMVISDLGVARDLRADRCRYLLDQCGAPELDELDT
jgi:hypothetical protein